MPAKGSGIPDPALTAFHYFEENYYAYDDL